MHIILPAALAIASLARAQPLSSGTITALSPAATNETIAYDEVPVVVPAGTHLVPVPEVQNATGPAVVIVIPADTTLTQVNGVGGHESSEQEEEDEDEVSKSTGHPQQQVSILTKPKDEMNMKKRVIIVDTRKTPTPVNPLVPPTSRVTPSLPKPTAEGCMEGPVQDGPMGWYYPCYLPAGAPEPKFAWPLEPEDTAWMEEEGL